MLLYFNSDELNKLYNIYCNSFIELIKTDIAYVKNNVEPIYSLTDVSKGDGKKNSRPKNIFGQEKQEIDEFNLKFNFFLKDFSRDKNIQKLFEFKRDSLAYRKKCDVKIKKQLTKLRGFFDYLKNYFIEINQKVLDTKDLEKRIKDLEEKIAKLEEDVEENIITGNLSNFNEKFNSLITEIDELGGELKFALNTEEVVKLEKDVNPVGLSSLWYSIKNFLSKIRRFFSFFCAAKIPDSEERQSNKLTKTTVFKLSTPITPITTKKSTNAQPGIIDIESKNSEFKCI